MLGVGKPGTLRVELPDVVVTGIEVVEDDDMVEVDMVEVDMVEVDMVEVESVEVLPMVDDVVFEGAVPFGGKPPVEPFVGAPPCQ